MSIKDYSTTAGSNTSIDGINIAEGCLPGNVNNAMRAMMADTRSFYQSGGWIDLGYTHTYASSTSFTVSSDVTAFYPVGQRVRAVGATTGTIYGTITASAYSAPNTTVTVSWDSGSLQSEALTVSVSFMTVTGSPVSAGDVTGPASTTENNVPQWDSATKQLKDGLAVGASANSLVQLDSGGALPAVSGQNLTDLKAAVTGSSSNLAGAYATAATATYTADEIILKNSSGSTYVAKSVSFTVDITASGVNGLDTGSEASNTWYYVHAVYNGTSTNGLISASATAPTLPSGYTYSALMGVIRNDGSGDFFPFLQKDRKISTQPNSVFASVAGVSSFTSVSVSSQVPPIAKSCDGWFGHASINITSGVRVASDANGLGAQALAAQSSGIVYDGYAIRMTFIDLKCPSQTIYWASVNVGTATHAMAIVGYQI